MFFLLCIYDQLATPLGHKLGTGHFFTSFSAGQKKCGKPQCLTVIPPELILLFWSGGKENSQFVPRDFVSFKKAVAGFFPRHLSPSRKIVAKNRRDINSRRNSRRKSVALLKDISGGEPPSPHPLNPKFFPFPHIFFSFAAWWCLCRFQVEENLLRKYPGKN